MVRAENRGRVSIHLESSGVYYRKLLRSLMIASSIFALISLAIFSIVQFQFANLEKRSNEVIFNSQLNLLNTSMQYIEQTMSSVDTYAINTWMDESAEVNWRYYYSKQLYKWLISASVKFGGISYMSALISNGLGGMVITPTGTCDLDFYYKEYTNLREEDKVAINGILNSTESKIQFFPLYSRDGYLTDLYIAYPYSSNVGNSILLTRFYISRFIEIAENQYPYIIESNGTVIPFRIDDEAASINTVILSLDGEEGKRLYSEYLSNMVLQYVSYFKTNSLNLIFILCWIILLVCYGVLLYFLVFRQAGHLYKPLFDAIAADSEDIIIDKNTDELVLIKERNDMLLQLADRLERANKEALHEATIRVYRNLIEGSVGNIENDVYGYAVSIIKFKDTGEGSGNIASFQLLLQAKECEWLHCIPIGFDRFAVVIQSDSIADARGRLLDIVHSIPDDSDASVVLSHIVIGIHNLHKAYKQCLELLRIIPSIQAKQIITADDVVQSDVGYSFSTEEEAMLVSMIASGNSESLNLLSNIVSRNMDSEILLESKMNFCYCLVTMVSRLFSDLRKSPKDVIGRDIDYAEFYRNMSSDEIINTLQSIISDTVRAISCNSDESDARMLNQMKAFIHSKYMKDIGLQDLADEFNISPKYCGMVFAKLSDDTFKTYLNQYRIKEAKRILREEPTIKVQDLAHMVGFNSSTSFIRVFNKYTCMTPKAYADSISGSRS